MENTELQASTQSNDSLHWVHVTNISPTTTEDSFEYFLHSLFPITHCYLERNNNGYLESAGYFSISEENAGSIEGGFLSLNGQTHTLDTVDIKFEIVDKPSTNSPLIKLFHIPKDGLEYDLKKEISKFGTITNLHFIEGYRTARLNLKDPIESKRLVSSELFLNDEIIGVKFAGDELGNDDVLLNGNNSRPLNRGYTKSGVAFDDKKLYLTGFIEDIPYEEINSYFSRFGKVVDSNLVSIQNKYGPGMIRYGFVQVEDSSVGRKILEQRYHQIGRSRILVQHSVSKSKEGEERRQQYNRTSRRPYNQHQQQYSNRNQTYYQDHGYSEQYNRPLQMDYHQGGYPQQQWQPEAPYREQGSYQQAPYRQQGQYTDYNQGYEQSGYQYQGYEQQAYGHQQQNYGQRQYGQWQGNDNGNHHQTPHRGYGDRRTFRGTRRR